MNTQQIIISKRSIMFVVILNLILVNLSAQAETTNCTEITYVPYNIYSQGVYCFTGHLSTNMTSGNVITIHTNNVTIDMNGYKLGGLGAGTGTTAKGITATFQKNITIRNGTIRGFYVGIFIIDNSPYDVSQGHLVENILVDQSRWVGIWVTGSGNTIRQNQVIATGGSTFSSSASGILSYGPGNNVKNNRVVKTIARDTAFASSIHISEANDTVVQANRISETTAPGGNSYGIRITNSDQAMARDNIIIESDYGIHYGSNASGKYMGNLTGNIATTAFTGGTAVGTNN